MINKIISQKNILSKLDTQIIHNMKKILFLSVIILKSIFSHGQTSEPVYIIFTSHENPTTGIQRRTTNYLIGSEKYPPIFFYIKKDDARMTILPIQHFHFDVEKLRKKREIQPSDTMEIRMESIRFLQTIQPVDLDVMLPEMTAGQIEAWLKSLHDKKLYMIDRNDIVADSLKIIQARYKIPISY